jgi:hypothetical protein
MAYFQRTDPAVKAQRALEAKLKEKLAERDAKAAQIAAAEAKLAEIRATVEQEGDEAKLEAAVLAEHLAERKIAALDIQRVKIAQEIAGLEAQIEAVVDARMRNETALAVNAMADRFAAAAQAYEASSLELEESAKEAGRLIPEGVAIFEFTKLTRTQLPPAVELVLSALKSHAKLVLSGAGKPSLPAPPPEPVKLAVVPSGEPVVTVFVTAKNIMYVDGAGELVRCGMNRRHVLPTRIANLALDANVAITITPANRTHIQSFEGLNGQLEPLPENCLLLGPPPGKKGAPKYMRPGGIPVMHSLSPTSFEPLDRGKPIVGTMKTTPVEPLKMTGTRTLPEDES